MTKRRAKKPNLTVLQGGGGIPSEGRVWFSGFKLNIGPLADHCIEELNLIPHADGTLYHYESGVYKATGTDVLKHYLCQILGEERRNRHLVEVEHIIKAQQRDVQFVSDPHYINCLNGRVHISKGTGNNAKSVRPKLTPHDPEFLTITQLPVEWHARAKCPAFDQFLEDVGFTPDMQRMFFECLGAAIYAEYLSPKVILLIGPGGNGKSVLLAVVRRLVGAENYSCVSLHDLAEDRFASYDLHGKLVNLCGDLDARSVTRSDIFKQLTGGDQVRVQKKHHGAFYMRSYATHFFAANEMPPSADQSRGYFARWAPISMTRMFRDTKDEEGFARLVNSLTTPEELSGILVKAVQGLHRVLKQGDIKDCKKVTESKKKMMSDIDTVRHFVEEKCLISAGSSREWKGNPLPDYFCHKKFLYTHYRALCEEEGRQAVAMHIFINRLENIIREHLQLHGDTNLNASRTVYSSAPTVGPKKTRVVNYITTEEWMREQELGQALTPEEEE